MEPEGSLPYSKVPATRQLTSTSVFNYEQLILNAEIMKHCIIECWGGAYRYSLRATQLCRFPVVGGVGRPYEIVGLSVVSFKCGTR
jgi:hypothetical protein